jgi:hypothetical protein
LTKDQTTAQEPPQDECSDFKKEVSNGNAIAVSRQALCVAVAFDNSTSEQRLGGNVSKNEQQLTDHFDPAPAEVGNQAL